MLDATAIVIIYAALGCLIAGVALTYEIWRRSVMLDRADGRGKFPVPKMRLGELVFFGLFVIVLWPYLAIMVVVGTRDPGDDDDDEWSPRVQVGAQAQARSTKISEARMSRTLSCALRG
jgi:hypothetical protein